MFSQIQKKLPDENMIKNIVKDPQLFNYIVQNELVEQIIPILPYYLINKDDIPVLPRTCEKYIFKDNKKINCKLSFAEFIHKKKVVLRKNSLCVLLSARYKCDTHTKSRNDFATHELVLEEDI